MENETHLNRIKYQVVLPTRSLEEIRSGNHVTRFAHQALKTWNPGSCKWPDWDYLQDLSFFHSLTELVDDTNKLFRCQARGVSWVLSYICGGSIQVLVAISCSWALHVVTFIKKFCCNFKRCIWIIPVLNV